MVFPLQSSVKGLFASFPRSHIPTSSSIYTDILPVRTEFFNAYPNSRLGALPPLLFGVQQICRIQALFVELWSPSSSCHQGSSLQDFVPEVPRRIQTQKFVLDEGIRLWNLSQI